MHEASHCVTAIALRQPVYSIEIYENGGGAFRQCPPVQESAEHNRQQTHALCNVLKALGPSHDPEPAWLRPRLTVLMAGPASDFTLCGDVYFSDLDLSDAHHMMSAFTFEHTDYDALLVDVAGRAWYLVDRYWSAVGRLASHLQFQGKVYGIQARQLMQNAGPHSCELTGQKTRPNPDPHVANPAFVEAVRRWLRQLTTVHSMVA